MSETPNPTHFTYKIGDKPTIKLPWSEVCMHLGVAGLTRQIEILSRGVQIYDEQGNKFSFPILHGEAGVYQIMTGVYQIPISEVVITEEDRRDALKPKDGE